jgi:uncharacterized peroxidase-related enzyme
MGGVPNLISTLAQSPAAVNAYLAFDGALAKGSLPRSLREQLALVVGEANSCDYCVSAHSMLGGKAGLSTDEVLKARAGNATDPKNAAALGFARKVVRERGLVSDQDVTALRTAGFSEGEIVEIVANTALNIFTNYFNHVAQTVVDFPPAPKLESCGCGH